ncbi:hypothetical protein Tco_1048494 [Tanacetum coccineum]
MPLYGDGDLITIKFIQAVVECSLLPTIIGRPKSRSFEIRNHSVVVFVPGTVWGGVVKVARCRPSVLVIAAVVWVVPRGGPIVVKTRSYGALALSEACLEICLEAWSLCFFACGVRWVTFPCFVILDFGSVLSDTESDDTIQRKQADKKNKQKSTESESDYDFAVGTFVKYNEVEIKKKGKRPAVQKDSDSEAKVKVKAKINDKKAINSRMLPRNLKRVLYSLTTSQQKRLKQMGFGEFAGNFDFDYVPGMRHELGSIMLVVCPKMNDVVHYAHDVLEFEL